MPALNEFQDFIIIYMNLEVYRNSFSLAIWPQKPHNYSSLSLTDPFYERKLKFRDMSFDLIISNTLTLSLDGKVVHLLCKRPSSMYFKAHSTSSDVNFS